MEKAKSKGVTIHLPVDFVTGSKFGEDAEVKPATVESGIDSGYMVRDAPAFFTIHARSKELILISNFMHFSSLFFSVHF